MGNKITGKIIEANGTRTLWTFEADDRTGWFSARYERRIKGSKRVHASGPLNAYDAQLVHGLSFLQTLHLSDIETGAPLHAVPNAVYWAEHGKVENLATLLRISEIEAETHVKATIMAGSGEYCQNYFEAVVKGLAEAWRAEANLAHAMITEDALPKLVKF